MLTLAAKALAETAGTFLMVFVGGGSIILTEKFPDAVPSYIVPFAWGAVIALMIFAVGRISGAHFNPAVTLAFAVSKRLPSSHIPVYWASQAFGGIMAVVILGVIRKI